MEHLNHRSIDRLIDWLLNWLRIKLLWLFVSKRLVLIAYFWLLFPAKIFITLQILSAVRDNDITIISGSTGCGKSTHVPLFFMDQMLADPKTAEQCHILVATPRRIAATSLCRYVCSMRGYRVGDEVGYQVGSPNPCTRYQHYDAAFFSSHGLCSLCVVALFCRWDWSRRCRAPRRKSFTPPRECLCRNCARRRRGSPGRLLCPLLTRDHWRGLRCCSAVKASKKILNLIFLFLLGSWKIRGHWLCPSVGSSSVIQNKGTVLLGYSIDWLTDWLIGWLVRWLVDWPSDWLIDWLTAV